jgi:hypothetical protein
MEPLWTAAELAELIRSSPAGVAMLRHRGTGPKAIKAAGKLLFPESEIRRWLAERGEDGIDLGGITRSGAVSVGSSEKVSRPAKPRRRPADAVAVVEETASA